MEAKVTSSGLKHTMCHLHVGAACIKITDYLFYLRLALHLLADDIFVLFHTPTAHFDQPQPILLRPFQRDMINTTTSNNTFKAQPVDSLT